MALSEKAKETMEKLGHDTSQVEGGDIDDSEAASFDSQTEEQEAPVEEPKTEESQDDAGLDQPNDKTWQSKYDKTVYEKQLLEERLEREEKERQLLYQTLTGLTTQKEPQQTQEKKEPVLTDFINPSDYNSLDALDPSTASGQAYHQWQTAVVDYRTEQNLTKFQEKQAEERKSQIALKQAKVLADKFPEFRNSLTGQPDMNRISDFMNELSNSDEEQLWADLYAWKTGKTTTSRPSGEQIGRKANQVQSVSSQPGMQTEKRPQPKVVSDYVSYFGDNFEYPEGAEFKE